MLREIRRHILGSQIVLWEGGLKKGQTDGQNTE